MRTAPALAALLMVVEWAGAVPSMAATSCRETRLGTVVCTGAARPLPRPPIIREDVPWTRPAPGARAEGPPPMARRSRLGTDLQPGLGESAPDGMPCRQTRLGDLRC